VEAVTERFYTFKSIACAVAVLAVAASGVTAGWLFETWQDFPAGERPWSVAIRDLNGDGIRDLAVASTYSDDISVLVGRGDATFEDAVAYSVGYYCYPSFLAVGDLNGDGNDDLVVTVRIGDYVAVLLGNGDGTYQAYVPYDVGVGPYYAAIVDLDDDGNVDLAVANPESHDVSVLLGNGDGTFQPSVDYYTSANPLSIGVSDYDEDGNLDLAVACFASDRVTVLAGNGDGTFWLFANITTGDMPRSLAVGDLDEDGHDDLAVCNHGDDDVSVFLGNGDGTFQPRAECGAGVGPVFVVIDDLNADGHDDLTVANLESDDVSILLGNGDGTFQVSIEYSAGDQSRNVAIGEPRRGRRQGPRGVQRLGVRCVGAARTGRRVVRGVCGVRHGRLGDVRGDRGC